MADEGDDQAREHDHASPSERLTAASERYFRAHDENLSFIGFISHLALRADEVRKIAARALLDGAHDDEDKAELQESLDAGDVVTSEFRGYRQLILETMLTRGVENFLAFLSHSLAVLFRTRPEMLRSSETIRLDTVLAHGNMIDLIEELSDRKVEQLSYQGMRDLNKDCSERWGLDLFTAEEDLERGVRIIETRNLIVHNRAVVNRRYLARVPNSKFSLGEHLEFDFDETMDDVEFLAHRVNEIDGRLIQKFGVPTLHWSGPNPGPSEDSDD